MAEQVDIICPNCGAQITNGLCEYCGQHTDMETFNSISVKNVLPKGIEVTCNEADLGICKVHDSHNHSEYSYGIANHKGIILPCIYKIPYSIYDGKVYIVEKSYRCKERGLFNIINEKLLMPCELWTSQPFINTRYVKCQIGISYGILDLETLDFVLPCIYSKISIKDGELAEIELMGKRGLDGVQYGVWDVGELDFVLPMGRHIPCLSNSTCTHRYIAVSKFNLSKGNGVWDMKEKRFVVPCKYSTIDEIDPKTNVVKARNFGFWGDKEITIQL